MTILSFIQTTLAFLVTLSILIVVHEYGHYRVAVACGVKVLRFSLGFGKPLFTWKRGADQTEFSIAPIPFGGYVRMLDEREAPVEPEELHRAFNRKPLLSRFLIVLAGPVTNLILAILLFAIIAFAGIEDPKAILAEPTENSMLQLAGVRTGDEVVGLAMGQGAMQEVKSISDFHMTLTQAAFSQTDVQLQIKRSGNEKIVTTLPMSRIGSAQVDASLMQKIGYAGLWSAPVITRVMPGDAAQKAGLQAGDIVKSIDGRLIGDALTLIKTIRASTTGAPFAMIVERGGILIDLQVYPAVYEEAGETIGRIGVEISRKPEMVTIRYGIWGSLNYGAGETWRYSWLTLTTIGKMIVGQASLKNLSGPITIADLAGQTVRIGWIHYIKFLALISLSLGVLNLLPLPVLDGGHLVYYAYEGIRGKPVPEQWMINFQKVGILLLLLLMFVATFNDIARLASSP